MISTINESKTLTEHMSCKCKFKFESKKYNANQKWNNNECWCDCEHVKNICEKESYLELCNMYWENGKYVGSIIDDSVIICDEIVEGTRLVTTYNTSTNVYVLLAFSLITMAFLIAVSIYCLYTISQLKETGY